MKKNIFILFLIPLFISCAHDPTYVEQLSQRPLPTNDQGITQECAWIRSEIARMESVSAYSTRSQYALAFQAMARNNIAALNSRAANIGCKAAFSNVINTNNSSSINDCIKACKENTNRSSDQCFDVCNH